MCEQLETRALTRVTTVQTSPQKLLQQNTIAVCWHFDNNTCYCKSNCRYRVRKLTIRIDNIYNINLYELFY